VPCVEIIHTIFRTACQLSPRARRWLRRERMRCGGGPRRFRTCGWRGVRTPWRPTFWRTPSSGSTAVCGVDPPGVRTPGPL